MPGAGAVVMSMGRWLYGLGVALTVAVVCTTTAAEHPAPVLVPFVRGLTAVSAISEARGDYESLRTLTSIGKDGYRVRVSGQVPGDPDPYHTTRIVTREDQAAAHDVRLWMSEGDPDIFPGTVPGISVEMLTQLMAQGSTRITYVLVKPGLFGINPERKLSGTLRRVGDGSESMRMLVNGQEAVLPVIHARGTLSGTGGDKALEIRVLADPANPMLLGWNGIDHHARVVRIEYPVAHDNADSIEQRLRKHETVQVHSIYFGFNSAVIRPESKRVLTEIAGILTRNPDWKLQIDGHTDAVGNDADNLALSERRAAAVKAALVDGWHTAANRLATGGYGESRPADTNDTPEGRSHNRRVELRRQ